MGRPTAPSSSSGTEGQRAPDLRLHARAYLAKGWVLVPLWWVRQDGVCACPTAGECKSAGKHPHTQHGTRAPLRTGLDVDIYWSRHPDCNIGIATGAASGLIVLDIDPGKGGWDSMRQLWKRYGAPGPTLVSVTGGGGRHVMFKHPGSQVKNAIGYMPGIDIRGDGGLVVAPPSMHGSGRRYTWHPDGHPRDKKLIEMPGWMHTFVEKAEQKRRNKNAGRTRRSKGVDGGERYGRSLDPDLVPTIGEGERNDTLCSIAGRLIWENRNDDEVMAMVQRINNSRCKPPLPDKEVHRLVTHACRRWAGR